jgi:hypothetical protein
MSGLWQRTGTGSTLTFCLAVFEAVSVAGVELLLAHVKANRSAPGAHAGADRDDHVVGRARLAHAPRAHPQSGQARRGGGRVRPRKSDRGAVDGSGHLAGAQCPAGLARPPQRLTQGRVARGDADDGTDWPAGVIEDCLADRGADRPRCVPAGLGVKDLIPGDRYGDIIGVICRTA